jgi:peptidyl-prolyl cis-trans isomerase C
VTLRQAFFDRGRRGADGARRAAEDALRKAFGQGAEVAAALGGDPFVMGKRLVAQGALDLDKFFGPNFSRQALSLPQGSWEGPLESVYGWHAVFVEQRSDPRIPDLAEVRSRVEKTYENERRNARVAEYLEHVRPHYDIRIDEAEIRGGADD